MSVAQIDGWRLPGCSIVCRPNNHNPMVHEQYGRLLEQQEHEQLEVVRTLLVRTGGVVLDGAAGTLTVNGLRVHTTPIETAMLVHLGLHLGELCNCNEILNAIWLRRHYDHEQVAPSHWQESDRHLVRTHISRLRTKFGRWRHLIETVDGQGYRLVAARPEPWLAKDTPARTARPIETGESFGARIRKLRRDCYWTQAVMAQTIGVTRETVAKWETNVWTPSLPMLARIADTFGIDPAYLRGE